jgi:hypothetical protein
MQQHDLAGDGDPGRRDRHDPFRPPEGAVDGPHEYGDEQDDRQGLGERGVQGTVLRDAISRARPSHQAAVREPRVRRRFPR